MARATRQTSYTFNMREAHTVAVIGQQGNFTLGELLGLVRTAYALVEAEALDFLIDVTRGRIMARGKGGKEPEATTQWTRFIDIPMAGVTVDDINSEYGDGTSVGAGVDGLVRAGYRIGISFNGQTQSYIVSLTCRDEHSPNAGCTVTSHAGDWWFALAVMCYKHYVVAREDWTSLSPSGPSAAFG